MELVTFLETFPKDCSVCITNGRFVVYTGSIKQFLTIGEGYDFERRVYGDYKVQFANIDRETGRLMVSIMFIT